MATTDTIRAGRARGGKVAADRRWVAAVNADGHFGRWNYAIAYDPNDVPELIERAAWESVAART